MTLLTWNGGTSKDDALRQVRRSPCRRHGFCSCRRAHCRCSKWMVNKESLMADDAENADSDEIGDLDRKMIDLEEEHSNIIGKHKDYMLRIKKLRASVGELSVDLKIQTDTDVADLEGEISRLRHVLQESDAELEATERKKASLMAELDARDERIKVLERNVEELESEDLAEEEMQRCLDEKERVIREINGGRRWMVVGGTAIATAAAVICYFHAPRKH